MGLINCDEGRLGDSFGSWCEYVDVNVGHMGNLSTLVSSPPIKVYLPKYGMDHNYGLVLIVIAIFTNRNGKIT